MEMIRMGIAQRRPINVLTATGGLGALLLGLALIDERVRQQIALICSGRGASGDFGRAFGHIQDVAGSALQVVNEQAMSHAPLAVFALAALVLVLFMTRT